MADDQDTVRRRARLWLGMIAALIVAGCLIGGLAISARITADDAKDVAVAEAQARARGFERVAAENRDAIRLACERGNVNALAIRTLVAEAASGSTITPELIASVTDPELRRVLEIVASGSAGERTDLIELANAATLYDCTVIPPVEVPD